MQIPWTPAEVVARILEAAGGYEFDTFVIGLSRELARSDPSAEQPLRELKAAVGRRLLEIWPGREVDFLRPQIRFDVSPASPVRVSASPLFVAGRYRKLSRETPASRWIHHTCRGAGCASCRWTGELNGPSVEELISRPLLEACGGEETLFHALGREDTDARMLGDGRPFVVEIRGPRRRRIDLRRALEESTRRGRGRAEFILLRLVERDAVRLIKEARAEKTYRVWLRLAAPPPPDVSERLQGLKGQPIRQRSPTRVMHRRGESTLRIRQVLESRWLGEIDGRWAWEVRAAAGTYIKELVSGDGGRTRPSVADVLGVDAECLALDVIAIHWSGLLEEEL